VEEAKGIETTLDVVEGMQFDKGYLSPYFVTNAESMEVLLDNAYLLINEKKISSLKDMLPLLEKVAKTGRPLLIIAEDVEGEALATLVVNKLRGILNIADVAALPAGRERELAEGLGRRAVLVVPLFSRERFFGAHVFGEALRQWPTGFREQMEPRLRAALNEVRAIFAELPLEWLNVDGDESLPVQLDVERVTSVLNLPFSEPDTFWKLP
jgi:hypothetical protein